MIVFGALCFQDFNSFLMYFGFFVGTRSSKNFLAEYVGRLWSVLNRPDDSTFARFGKR